MAGRVSADVLLDRIAEVFRLYGYEGASIRLLAEATGLERASLYHRFPGGKEQMAAAMLAKTGEWLEEHVFAVLGASGSPRERVKQVVTSLKEFYRKGTLWCVMDSMTLGGGPEPLRRSVRGAYTAWLEAFAGVARECGAGAAQARARAQQALVEIEGSLVIARVMGDNQPFLKALEHLPSLLLGEPEGS